MIARKIKCPIRTLQIGYAKFKHLQKFKYWRNVLTREGKCDIQIHKRIARDEDAVQMLNKVLRNRKKNLLETKKIYGIIT